MTVTPDLRKGILLMLISSICACLGQLLWKISADRGMLFVIAGFLLYGVGGLTMVVAYRFGRLSVLQPMMSLNYVLSILLAAFVLRENITLIKCIGVFLIIAGVVFIAGSDDVPNKTEKASDLTDNISDTDVKNRAVKTGGDER